MSSGLFNKFKLTQKQSTGAKTLSDRSPLPSTGASKNQMSPELFLKFRDFIYEKSGIYFTETKKYLLEGRISKRIDQLKMKSFDEYFRFVSAPTNSRKELPALFEAVTINETYFFRNEPQFQALESIITPEILKGKAKSPIKKFRVWSAACSSGEEPYTVAMLLLEKIKPKFPQFQFEVIGNDIDSSMLQKARGGVYKEYSVRNMPKYYLQKYFTKQNDRYVLNQEVRNMVRFMSMNLYDSNAMRTMANYDVIFCCNVLIYFDQKSKQKVVANLYDSLAKNGYLFIGYSESLHGISKAFKLVHFPKTISYKKE